MSCQKRSVWQERRYRWKGDVLDEELGGTDKVGKAEEVVKGVKVSVSEDASNEEDEVSDGVPSVRSGSKSVRDTLGNASLISLKTEVTGAGKTDLGDLAGSGVRVSTLVTAPVASIN